MTLWSTCPHDCMFHMFHDFMKERSLKFGRMTVYTNYFRNQNAKVITLGNNNKPLESSRKVTTRIESVHLVNIFSKHRVGPNNELSQRELGYNSCV